MVIYSDYEYNAKLVVDIFKSYNAVQKLGGVTVRAYFINMKIILMLYWKEIIFLSLLDNFFRYKIKINIFIGVIIFSCLVLIFVVRKLEKHNLLEEKYKLK